MFNFTTQTIYNTINVVAANAGPKAIKAANVITSANGEPKPWVRFGNTRFDKGHVIEVQHKKHTPESLAKVSFDIDKAIELVTQDQKDKQEGSYRIVLYLGLSMNNQDSFYANDFVYKGKPLFVEFPIKASDSAKDVTKRIEKIANRYMLFQAQEKILSVFPEDGEPAEQGEEAPEGTVITFEGVNGYQQIRKAVLQKYDPNANQIDCCSTDGDFVDIMIGVPVKWELDEDGYAKASEGNKVLDADGERDLADNEVPILPGLEAFCDYNWIIHNLRLPTLANTDFWAWTKPEQPVVGGEYDQFVIRICYDRDNIGGEVVGQRATSVTTHVLYVLDDGTQNGNIKKVEDELKKLIDSTVGYSAILERADTVLENPYGSE